jgi:hypothetical protein
MVADTRLDEVLRLGLVATVAHQYALAVAYRVSE